MNAMRSTSRLVGARGSLRNSGNGSQIALCWRPASTLSCWRPQLDAGSQRLKYLAPERVLRRNPPNSAT